MINDKKQEKDHVMKSVPTALVIVVMHIPLKVIFNFYIARKRLIYNKQSGFEATTKGLGEKLFTGIRKHFEKNVRGKAPKLIKCHSYFLWAQSTSYLSSYSVQSYIQQKEQ